MECVLSNTIKAGECDLFICEPKAIHVRNDLYEKYGWNLRKAKILLHMRGRVFVIPGKLVFAKKD